MAASAHYRYTAQPAKPHSPGRFWGILAMAILIAAGWGGWRLVSSISAAPTTPAFVPLDKEKQLQQVLDKYSSVDAAVELEDVRTGLTASENATQPFTAASTTKLVTAIFYLHLVEQGKHSLTELVGLFPAQTQLQQLVNQSNNDSWTALHDVVGRDDEQAYAKTIGLTSFNQASNTIDTADLAILLVQLWQGKLLSPEHTKLLLSWMQNTNDEDLIPSGLPAGAVVYHKYGELDAVVHDAAIVTWKGRTYVWIIMSDGNGIPDYDTRQKMFLELTQAAFSNLAPG